MTAGGISINTTYDGFGRKYQVSNPAKSGIGALTTYAYDVLGRVISVTAPDNYKTTTDYLGKKSTGYDSSGVTGKTISIMDGAGRLIQVIENDGGTPVYNSYYGYDAGNNLTVVCQGAALSSGTCPSTGLGRSFTYDTLGRLKQASNPESPMSYTYDQNGNVSTKQDGLTWIATTLYDALNRPYNRTYSQTTRPPGDTSVTASSVDWIWDTVQTGRLSSVTSGAVATLFTQYDSMGRPTQSTQRFGTVPNNTDYSFTYTYNKAGGLETEYASHEPL